jgi:putative FmdB family regulatory protein
VPIYAYRCKECRNEEDHLYRSDDFTCDTCGGHLIRAYSFAQPSTFQPHFNASVGRYVRSDTDFRSALSEASDNASAYTGITHNFQPRDMHDTDGLGMSSGDVAEAKDTVARQRHAGLIP